MNTVNIDLIGREIILECDLFNEIEPIICMREKINEDWLNTLNPQSIIDDLMYNYGFGLKVEKVETIDNPFCNMHTNYYFTLMEPQKIFKEETWFHLIDCLVKVIHSIDDDKRYDKKIKDNGNILTMTTGVAREYLCEKLAQYKDVEFYFEEKPFDNALYLRANNFPTNIEGNIMFDIFSKFFVDECFLCCSQDAYYKAYKTIYTHQLEEYDYAISDYEVKGDYTIELDFDSDVDKRNVKASVLDTLMVLLGRRFND